MQKKLGLWWLIFSLVYIVEGWAAAPTADRVLIIALQKMQNFQAHFQQRIRTAAGEQVVKTQGEVAIMRPNKFRWESHPPYPMLVVADGRFLWTYDIELAQVTKQNLQHALHNSPAMLLAGSVGQLKEQFKIEYASLKRCKQGSEQCFQLQPLQKEAPFAEILLAFTGGKLTQIRMRDPLGQDVDTLFSQVKINALTPSRLFHFIPPAGVDIIYDEN